MIHTCREKDFKEKHFDVQQMNFILWNTPDALATKLYNRIMAVMNQGPFAKRE